MSKLRVSILSLLLVLAAVGGFGFYAKSTKAVYNNLGIQVKGSASDVDAKSASTTTIHTTDTDEEIHTFAVNVECTSASGVIIPGIVSVGTNDPDYNNLASLITVPSTAGISRVIVLEGISVAKVPEETAVKVKVNTAATATTQNFRVALIGHNKFP